MSDLINEFDAELAQIDECLGIGTDEHLALGLVMISTNYLFHTVFRTNN